MTTNEKYEAVKQKIVDDNPEIKDICDECSDGWDVDGYICEFCGGNAFNYRPITLEDVLIALDHKNHSLLNATDIDNGENESGLLISRELGDILFRWKWGKNLEWHKDNKTELIDFLYEILIK